MAKQIRSLKSGDKVTGYFRGGDSIDGGVYSLKLEFLSRDESGEKATFRDVENGDTFDVYKFNGRWSYGSGANSFSVRS